MTGDGMRSALAPHVSAAYFVPEKLRVYAIVDSGATWSMSGVQLMAHVQQRLGLRTRV